MINWEETGKLNQVELEFEAIAFAVDDNEDGTLDIEFTVKQHSPYEHFKFYDFPRKLVGSIQEGKRYNVYIIMDEIE